ncbi:MAG: hypothetical protein UH788_00440 [Treponemataceae bacterium]|nr:hypothetical protein [Treponemataceae bacterium]
MKKIILFYFVICFSFFCFSQEIESDEFDDFDSLFAEAEDVVVEEQTAVPTPIGTAKSQSIKFTGFLDTDVGFGFSISPDDYFKPLGYFAFENYTYMNARASDIFGIRATLKTQFPQFAISLHEIYFDYLLLDFLYIQAGKRDITWGNTELIEHNILSDSINGTSIGFSFNLFNTNFSGIVMSQVNWGGGISPEFSNLSIAGSIEKVFGNLQLNLFGRKWATEDSNHKNPVIGLESKINLWGFDLYNQTISHIKFDFENFSNTILDKLYFTLGLMKDWENPRIGFIIEYEWIFYDKNLHSDKKDSHKIHFKGLVSRLFKSTSKIGLEFEHDFVENKGIITPGYIYYALAHTDVKVGIPITFSPETWSVVPAVALTFEWNY